MTIAMPKRISEYFASDAAGDADAVSQCFTTDAEVKDEGHTYVGRESIRKWKADSGDKYTYTVEPFAIVEQGDQIVVSSHVAGNFPGSPIDLRYAFTVEDDHISAMSISA